MMLLMIDARVMATTLIVMLMTAMFDVRRRLGWSRSYLGHVALQGRAEVRHRQAAGRAAVRIRRTSTIALPLRRGESEP